MWTKGTLNIDGKEVRYCLKHFDEPSEYGIEQGRISKLELRTRKDEVTDYRFPDDIICNYDRGWDVKATSQLAKKALKQLLADFN